MVEWVNLTVINDNKPNPPLLNDWGWSVLVETDQWTLLYDADTESRIMENNINVLGINLSKVDAAFLSHYHRDHYGGFEYIGKVRSGLIVYVPETDKVLTKWGLTPVTVNSPREILKDAVTTGTMRGMGINEHSLVVKLSNYGSVVIVGCSHPGIDNIVRKVHEMFGNIYLVIGGFHEPSRRQLDVVAEYSRYICPAHCSGDEARNYVKSNYSNKYCNVKTGISIKLPAL